MNIEFKLKSKNAKSPLCINNNTYDLYASDIQIGESGDTMQILSYSTDIDIIIPEGFVGIVVPNENLHKTSLMQVKSPILLFGTTENFNIEFKNINNVKPVIYRPDDIIVRLFVIKYDELLKCNIIEFAESDDTKIDNQKDDSIERNSNSEPEEHNDEDVEESLPDIAIES